MLERKIGKYTVVGEIGRGAMGIVYKGIDPYIGRTVAIKTIRFDLVGQKFAMEEAQSRFLREARSAGSLSHPNIVTVYEVGEDAEVTFIVMEYIGGPSLEELLESGTKFTLEEIVELVGRIADGLESAHRKGITHRDIKPGNILIDPEKRPHIVDFGIARLSTSTLTQASTVMGTPFYMAPEQITGRAVDHRADIFSLGCILYELLASQRPFIGESVTTVIYRILNENPPPLRTVQKNLPESLEYIVNKALAKNPESRYQSCRDLIEDLKNYPKLALRFQAAEDKKTRRSFPALLVASLIVFATAAVVLFFLVRGKPGSGQKIPPKGTAQAASLGSLQNDNAQAQKKSSSPDRKQEGEAPGLLEVRTRGESQTITGEKLPPKASGQEAVPSLALEKKESPDADRTRLSAGAKKAEGKKPAGADAATPVLKNADAEKQLREQREKNVRGLLEAARGSFDAGNFQAALSQARKALSLDAGHAEAAKLFLSASMKLAPEEIKALMDQYVQSVKEKHALEFYKKNCSSELYQKIHKDTELLFVLYDEIQAAASNLTVVFKETSVGRMKAEAGFFHILTGRSRSKGTRQVLFEGIYQWSLENAGENWLITDIQYDLKQK